MKDIRWDLSKNEKLKSERDVSFEAVLVSIQQGNVLDDVIHPDREKYPNQRLLVVKLKEYAYLVPYIETETEIFLKTIIPSRKATKKYLRGSNSNE
ncbi:MAG: BrnT family toxin [Chamaesiphon sp.]|nr:BrnT family toxin [Chamaesiphon sp.]